MSMRSEASGEVIVEVSGRVVVVKFNRPGKRNALTQAMYSAVAKTLERAEADLSVAAVILTGSGDSFTSGNDLQEFSSGGNIEQGERFLQVVASLSVPLVAAVNGMAIGIGFTMLLHCDLVYVEPAAVLSAPFVSLGLVPEAASSLLLPRIIGERRASEILLAGRTINGSEAAQWGLANEAVSPALTAAHDAAQRLACQPPRAMRATKALLRSSELTISGRMREETESFMKGLAGAEFAEAMAARKLKRPPVF